MEKPFVSSGAALINLAMTGRVNDGFQAGKYYFFVGDSNSGKTFLSLTCFAEATLNPVFKDYRLIHDNTEDGALMDLSTYFGQAVADKIEPPKGTREQPIVSRTVEEFYFNVDDAIADGRPFIYILDSMDALTTQGDLRKFTKLKGQYHKTVKGQDPTAVAGTYGTSRAKLNSAGMREVVTKLKNTNSILIVISQSRDALGFGFADKTYSGGHALKFYAQAQIWTSVVKTITKKVRKKSRDKTRKLGVMVKIKTEKNRHTGRNIHVHVPIYWSTGIDDIGGCVQFLIEEGFWSAKRGKIDTDGFMNQPLDRETLIQQIEQQNLHQNLYNYMQRAWDEIKAECQPRRQNKYSRLSSDGERSDNSVS